MKTAHGLSQSTIKELTGVVLTYKLLTQMNQSLALAVTLIKPAIHNCLSFILSVELSASGLSFSKLQEAQESEVKVKVEGR